jgi:hypothetical protein
VSADQLTLAPVPFAAADAPMLSVPLIGRYTTHVRWLAFVQVPEDVPLPEATMYATRDEKMSAPPL